MSGNTRPPSTVSASPQRSQHISRPHWPWTPGTYAQRGLPSPHSSTSTPIPGGFSGPERSSLSYSTYSSNSRSATPKVVAPFMGSMNGESTRQWTLTGFEWAVKDVSKLRDFVESRESDISYTADDFELLKQSPTLGESKYKLEIALTSPSEDNSRSFLSLFITSLVMDYAHGDFESSATMLAAIKCEDEAAGHRGARPEWVWEFWQHDWVFRQGSEVWECPLPILSDLLENERIRQTNSFVICVQIHSPSGPTIPQQPSVCYVPKDLLAGLEASLDNPNTGDVRFICLERLHPDAPTDLASSVSSLSRQSSSSASSQAPFSSHITGRKRVIYAHSDILIRRSEYFATMLTSSFSESSSNLPHGERKFHTIVVEEAEFETIYWLLKYCYANWLLFKQQDDPRAAVEGVGGGWSARWLNSRENEWDWKTFHKSGSTDDAGLDSRSAASADSLAPGGTVSRSPSRVSADNDPGSQRNPSTASARLSNTKTTTATSGGSGSSSRPPTTPRRPTAATGAGTSASSARPKPVPVSTSGYAPPSHYPNSPRVPRAAPTPDPHPHPTPSPMPASALSMYQVAHRYSMGSLAALALEHIMSTLTPNRCFAMLLASYTWDELHDLVEDYVIEKWDEVSLSEEFERCCEEVAAGEWGADGGATLMSVFRRLRSPAAAAV